MSCDANAGRITRLASRIGAGVSRLAGQRGFYAGLALGTAGLVGAGLVALARRRSAAITDRGPDGSPALAPVLTLDQPSVPQLRSRSKVEPASRLLLSERCADCRTPAGSKPGAWYQVSGRPYCPDCAPEAANRAGVDLVAPVVRDMADPPTRGQSGAEGRVMPAATRTPVTGISPPQPLPPENRVPTRLTPSRIGLRLGQDASGPVIVPVNNGYVALRPDGSDTGLAITPALKVNDSDSELQEDTGRWWVTHIPSGKSLPGAGPYRSPEEAHLLASVLAQLDWTRDETELTTEDHRRAGATVTAFNHYLAEAEQRGQPAPAGATTALTTLRAEPVPELVEGQDEARRPSAPESLVGKILADGMGGVARVLEERGHRLFMIDSLGTRYEIDRNETRLPDESDFELCRVAMPFDPASSQGSARGAAHAAARCDRCDRSPSPAGAGERWHKMGWKSFCETCARRYAAEEGYALEDEIGDEVELSR